MSGSVCPEGHTSADPEWCDTCGARIGGPAPVATAVAGSVTSPVEAVSPAAASPAPAGPTVACAHCGALNEVDALFCESCGYDFTTGQAPPQRTPVAAPAEPPGGTPTRFVLDVAIDPAWYVLQGTGSEEPCPPASEVRVPVRSTTVLIGRTSVERSISPEVSLDGDPGVSRRHAQLLQAADGTWSAVDLGSMNGTFVATGSDAPASVPAPLVVGEPVVVRPGQAVFVGAWSRIVLVDLGEPAVTPPNPSSPTSEP